MEETSKLLNSEKNNLNNNKKDIVEINKKTSIRFNIIDNYKGILIFTVVFAHFLYNYSEWFRKSLSHKIVNYIYSFHMPSFIFCSGFLSKSENSKSQSTIIKLILIYLIFNFSHGFILYKYYNKDIKLLHAYHSYWYLLCLIYWRIFIKFFSEQYFSITISFIVSILIGFWSEISNTLSLKRAFSFFPYFIVGYKFSIEKLQKILEIRKKFYISILISFFIFFLVSLEFIPYIETDHSMMFNNYKNYKFDIMIRIILFIFSFSIIIFSLLIIPDKKIIFLTKIGKNSLHIYTFHRIITIFIDLEIFKKLNYNNINIIQYSLILTFIILFIFGSDYFANIINQFINYIHSNIMAMNIEGKSIGLIFSILFIIILSIKPISIINEQKQLELEIIQNITLPVKYINLNGFDNPIRISYIGGLLLSHNGKNEFNETFKYISKYLQNSDLSIAVYKGISIDNNTKSLSNNNSAFLDYLEEFTQTIKKVGINLVSMANRHLLDNGIENLLKTLDLLNKYKITHTGSYKNKEEQNQILIINVKNIKFAVLSYVSYLRYQNTEEIYEKYPYITNFVPYDKNKYYKEIYKNIKNDFKKAKQSKADIILVLVHMGKQYSHTTKAFQKKWNKIFSDLGADIILGDLPQAVQPLEYLGKTFIVNCPGNFAYLNLGGDGDASSIVDLYFDKNSKKFIGSSIVPLYNQEYKPNHFRVLPIFKISNNSIQITSNERKRVNIIQKLITKVMIGKEIPICEAKEKYFFINNTYYDINNKESNLKTLIKEKFTNKQLYKLFDNSSIITFIGDTISENSEYNIQPWYEPLIYYFRNKKIINISKRNYNTELIIKYYKYQIIKSKSDLYIISLGTNDINSLDSKSYSNIIDDYIDNINDIVSFAKINNEKAKFVFISPLISFPYKENSKKNNLFYEFIKSLNNYCSNNNFIFINPNPYIIDAIQKNKEENILEDIYLNKKNGNEFFTKAVLINSE